MYRSRLNKIRPQKNDKNRTVHGLSNIRLNAKWEDTMASNAVNSTEAPILLYLILSDSGHLSKTLLLTPEQNNKKLNPVILFVDF